MLLVSIWLRFLRQCVADLRIAQSSFWPEGIPVRRVLPPAGPLRICLFSDHLASGGAERQLVLLAKGLRQRGHTVHLLCLTLYGANSQYLEVLNDADVSVHTVPYLHVLRNLWFCRTAVGTLQALRVAPRWLRINTLGTLFFLVKHNFDVLHCYLDAPNCSAGVAGVMARVPVVRLSARSLCPANPLWSKQADMVQAFHMTYRALLEAGCSLEANSRAGADDYAQWLSLVPEEIDVVWNGIVSEFIGNPSTPPNFSSWISAEDEGPTLLCIQRMSVEKRPLLPVQILCLVRDAFPEARLLYVGDGPMKNEVHSAVVSLNLEGAVSLLGTRTDIPQILCKADVFLLTSRLEGFPNVLMEAMLAGVPVVATRVGGVPELVNDNVHGYLVDSLEESSDDNSLATAMAERISSLLQHPTKARNMGLAGRLRVIQHFSSNSLVDKAESAYRRL